MEDDRKGTWEDVTDKCVLEWLTFGSLGGWANLKHDGHSVAQLGGKSFLGRVADGYRTRKDVRADHPGHLIVEHFVPDPEPVIAYKAVIEVNGEWVSTWAGGPSAGDQEQLSYAVGRTVTATRGPGVACFGDLESAREAFPSPLSMRGTNAIPRNHGRLLILEVQTIGEGAPSPKLHDAERRGAYCYPSVKVLSVAWEEKEEWVDVTDELTARAECGFGGYVNVWHRDVCVLSFGSRLHKDSMGRADYRVTTTSGGSAGRFKVEKRND